MYKQPEKEGVSFIVIGLNNGWKQEKYTSGTSYLDGEYSEKESYNKARRIKRGLFKSNRGILINADINAAYQIMKVAGSSSLKIKENEKTKC